MATKRLIDANRYGMHIADIQIANRGWRDDICEFLDDMTELLDEQPTVDAVEIPCRIGDRVWAIRNYGGHKHPQDGIVHEMYFTEGMRLIIHVKHIARGEWGKEIFATREEAVSAIMGGRPDA